MTFLFWNLNRKPLVHLVAALVQEHRVDVLMLAENRMHDSELLSAINSDSTRSVLMPPIHYPAEGLRILTSLSPGRVEPMHEGHGFSILHLHPPVGDSVLLTVVHLPSKLYLQDVEQALLVTRVVRAISEAEGRVQHSRTVVVGDFNMNPFEVGVASSEGFHAVMSSRVAARNSRTVYGEQRPLFYNPMWRSYANLDVPGTYFDGHSRPLCFFWNMFDQVLVRPALLNRFADDSLGILTSAGDVPLLTASQRPDTLTASDHLPIRFALLD